MPSGTDKERLVRRERTAELLSKYLSSKIVNRMLQEEFGISVTTAWRDIRIVVDEWQKETAGKQNVEILRSKSLGRAGRILRKVLTDIDSENPQIRIAAYPIALRYMEFIAKLQGLLEPIEASGVHFIVSLQTTIREKMKKVDPKDIKIITHEVKRLPDNGRDGRPIPGNRGRRNKN